MSLFRINFFSIIFLLFLAFSFRPVTLNAQEKKVKEPKDYHSPHKATLWSLIPGAGQIYNKKYWKLPIVYAGFAVTGYFAITNRNEYLKYSDAYLCAVNSTTTDPCEDPLFQKYSADYLKSYRDGYRRNMELSFILMGVWYLLQMLDATVDAHLYHWNVTDDISVRLSPVFQPLDIPNELPAHQGLGISVNF